MFLGTYEKQLDGKRRLQIPQEFRTAVSGVELGVFCLLSVTDDCLEAGGDEGGAAATECRQVILESLELAW